MRRVAVIAATIAAALGGGLAGTLSLGHASQHHRSSDGPGVQLRRVIAADPTMDAQCTFEPDGIPPHCVQGDYQVALTLGASCGSTPGMTWQTNPPGSGSGQVDCLPRPAPLPAAPPSPPNPRPDAGVVSCLNFVCRQAGVRVSFGLAGSQSGPVAGDSCGAGRHWRDLGAGPTNASGWTPERYACR